MRPEAVFIPKEYSPHSRNHNRLESEPVLYVVIAARLRHGYTGYT